MTASETQQSNGPTFQDFMTAIRALPPDRLAAVIRCRDHVQNGMPPDDAIRIMALEMGFSQEEIEAKRLQACGGGA